MGNGHIRHTSGQLHGNGVERGARRLRFGGCRKVCELLSDASLQPLLLRGKRQKLLVKLLEHAAHPAGCIR